MMMGDHSIAASPAEKTETHIICFAKKSIGASVFSYFASNHAKKTKARERAGRAAITARPRKSRWQRSSTFARTAVLAY